MHVGNFEHYKDWCVGYHGTRSSAPVSILDFAHECHMQSGTPIRETEFGGCCRVAIAASWDELNPCSGIRDVGSGPRCDNVIISNDERTNSQTAFPRCGIALKLVARHGGRNLDAQRRRMAYPQPWPRTGFTLATHSSSRALGQTMESCLEPIRDV